MSEKRTRGPKNGKGFKLFIIMAIFTAAFLNLPADHYNEAKRLREQLTDTRSENMQLTAVLEGSGLIELEQDRLEGEKERLEALVPLEQDLPFSLIKLEEAISRFPLTIHEIRAGGKSRHSPYSKIKIDLAVSGPPAEIETFLRQLNNLPYLISVDNLTWSSGNEEDLVVLDLELFFIDPAEVKPLLEWPEL